MSTNARNNDRAITMRTLAARMRDFAAQTDEALFRRQFMQVASELEEAAVDAESRAMFRPN